jgi:hypothetical protein
VPSIVPSPYPIAHIKRVVTQEIDPDTGTNVIVALEPVIRHAQGISQLGQHGSSHQVMGVEFLRRINTEIRCSVDDPSVYGPDDQILLFPEIDQDDGAYVEGSGVAFWIDGLVNDARQSPWPGLTRMFGGVLLLKRVT